MIKKPYLHLLLLPVMAISFPGCNGCCSNKENFKKDIPETTAIHNPIYPKAGSEVLFSLYFNNTNFSVKTVELKISHQELNDDATWSASIEHATAEWHINADTVVFPITYLKKDGFPDKSLITYTFIITPEDESKRYSHTVTFAVDPYPFSFTGNPWADQPAPVYVTADVNYACNIVVVPDRDMESTIVRPGGNWTHYFYNSVRDNIKNGFLLEPATRKYYKGFNFFVNHHQAGFDWERMGFVYEENYAQLAFAQAKCLMHHSEYPVEFSNTGISTFTSRIYNRGTFMHEAGHVLFKLGDEYEDVEGRTFRAIVPNIWAEESAAIEYAKSINTGIKNVKLLIETASTQKCYFICSNAGCQMGTSGLSIVPLGLPCQKAVDYYMRIYLTQ